MKLITTPGSFSNKNHWFEQIFNSWLNYRAYSNLHIFKHLNQRVLWFEIILIRNGYISYWCPLNNKNRDRTLYVVFSRFWGFSFNIALRQQPKGATRMLSRSSLSFNSTRHAPLGFCLRIIMYEKSLNLKCYQIITFYNSVITFQKANNWLT